MYLMYLVFTLVFRPMRKPEIHFCVCLFRFNFKQPCLYPVYWRLYQIELYSMWVYCEYVACPAFLIEYPCKSCGPSYNGTGEAKLPLVYVNRRNCTVEVNFKITLFIHSHGCEIKHTINTHSMQMQTKHHHI